MIWNVYLCKKVSALVFGVLLILSVILPNVAAESVTSVPSEVYAVMKHTKKITLVSIKNQSDEPIYAVALENADGDIRFVKTRGWDRERIDTSKVVVSTGDRPVMPGNNLIILLITHVPAVALMWTTADQLGNILVSGIVIERPPKSKEPAEVEGSVVESEPESQETQPSIPAEVVITVSSETASFTHNQGESACPQYIETVTIDSNESIALEVVDKPDWLTLQVNDTALLLYYNCLEGAVGTLSADITLKVKNPEGQVLDTITINVTGQVNVLVPAPPEVQVSVNTTDVSFTHDIGQSSCPQYIETVTIDSNESIALEVVDKPDWLTLQVNDTALLLYYNCLEGAVGTLSGILVLLLKSDDRVVHTVNISINGQVNPAVVPSQEGPLQEKTHKLLGDGYIGAIAKITCWEYGQEGMNISIRIDVFDAFRNKGRNLISAFIVDLTKNGPNSYIEIGHAVIPHEGYDYVAFSGLFDSKDFPSTTSNDPCPIGDVGRLVVVVGTSPPSDDDTLSEGSVDIIAASTSGTTETGEL